MVRGVLCSYFLWTNLSFRSGYEDRRPHLQRQISEVPLLYHILYRHSKPIKHVYVLKTHPVYVVHQQCHTLTDVWCRDAIFALSYLFREASITLRVQHFQSVKIGKDATECTGKLHCTLRTMQNEISSTHSFSPKQMGNDVIAGISRLRHTFHSEVLLPYVKSLKCCDPARR